jgi:predicted small metal-binding protein
MLIDPFIYIYKYIYYSVLYKEIMLTVSCREVGMDCDYVCKGETEEEIMKNAEEHAMKDHGYKPEDIMTPELRDKIRSHIKRSS